ncbi:MAG: J domain-containing protein [Nitrospirales bacterium]|nr:J domain-containing protein [Nitrospirales bacterium]
MTGHPSSSTLRSALGPAGVLLEELLVTLRKDWTKGVQYIQERIQDPHVQAWVAQDPGLLFLIGVTHPSAEQAGRFMTRFRQIWPRVRIEQQVLYQEVLRESLVFTILPRFSFGRHIDLNPWVRCTCNLSIHDQSAKFFLGYCAYQMNHYERAIHLLSGFTESWLASPAQLLMANAHIQLDQIPRACGCFRSLAEHETEKDRKVAFSILEAYLRADQGDRCIALVIVQRYQRWQALSPNLKKILWYLLGLWLYEEKEFPRAQKWLERVVALDPNFEDCQEIMRTMPSKRSGTSSTKFQQAQVDKENSPDPYTVLGVSRNATKEEIRQAYRKAMSGYHPDKVAHLGQDLQALAAQRAKSINQAYDSIKRERGG